MSEVPKSIATFLDLPDPTNYTGHCFRRTSATLLANAGANLTTLKQHGRWRSSSVAEGYIENLLHTKKKIYDKIVNSENLPPVNKNPSTDRSTTNLHRQNSTPSTSKVTHEPPAEKETLPLSSEDLEIINSFDFETPFSPIPNSNLNVKTNKRTRQTTLEDKIQEKSTKTLDTLNMSSPIIKIKKCKIMNVTINYSKQE